MHSFFWILLLYLIFVCACLQFRTLFFLWVQAWLCCGLCLTIFCFLLYLWKYLVVVVEKHYGFLNRLLFYQFQQLIVEVWSNWIWSSRRKFNLAWIRLALDICCALCDAFCILRWAILKLCVFQRSWLTICSSPCFCRQCSLVRSVHFSGVRFPCFIIDWFMSLIILIFWNEIMPNFSWDFVLIQMNVVLCHIFCLSTAVCRNLRNPIVFAFYTSFSIRLE